MIHHMKLHPLPFSQIECGNKTIELRLYDEKRQKIKIGDTILFTNTEDTQKTLTVRVTALHPFPSFQALYAALPLRACGYTAEEAKTASPRDMDRYYTPEDQARWGVVGIELSVL